MKIILSKDGITREIETPFGMCCDMKELDILIRTLQDARAAYEASNSPYGWFRVDTSYSDEGPYNTPPKPWAE